jgi:uncharacterized membrane protein
VTFAEVWPWWALVLALAAVGVLSWRAYAAPLVPRRRRTLVALRATTLLLLLAFLMRPVLVGPSSASGAVVPILLDVSRSMRIADADGARRVDRARATATRIAARLAGQFEVELLGFGEQLAALPAGGVDASANRTDLSGALAAAADRYRGRAVAGIVLLSDGGDTSGFRGAPGVAPVYAIGIGRAADLRDREVASLSAGDAPLPGSIVDLAATIVSGGFGRDPIEIRVLENGRTFATRRVTPAVDGAPLREVFQVPPAGDGPTIYTVEIPAAPGELVPENNTRSVLVPPAGRRRRVLLVEGAPGFEHSFLKRAWSADPGLDLDAVVRKGQNERGDDTFYIQGAADRAAALALGFPINRTALFKYDAIVLANVGTPFFDRERAALTEAFVAERGGGLLALGARSFAVGGIAGTPVGDLLPVDLAARAADVTHAAAGAVSSGVAVTAEGRTHPIMQLGASADETAKRWAAAPLLASVAPLGAPKPGARVLAVSSASGRAARPLVVVQRFGEGRTMVFGGEATWRWRMNRPSDDRMYETFWRQTARWLAAPSPDPVAVAAPPAVPANDVATIDVRARDAAFAPARGASVTAKLRLPDGRVQDLSVEPVDPAASTFRASFRPEQPGVYVVSVEARRGAERLGKVDRHVLAGGADVEMADPRLDAALLARVASATGGRVVDASDLDGLADLLAARRPGPSAPRTPRELWHGPIPFLLIAGLLSAEWILRRRWGLR